MQLTPFVINSHIVTNMHGIALSHSSSESPDDLRTVLTVPAAFTPDQRAAVAKSADGAGFNVVQGRICFSMFLTGCNACVQFLVHIKALGAVTNVYTGTLYPH